MLEIVFIVGDRRLQGFSVSEFLPLHQTDPIIHYYRMTTSDPNHFFEQFISLGRDRQITVTTANRPFLAQFCPERSYQNLIVFIGGLQSFAPSATERPKVEITLASRPPTTSGWRGRRSSHIHIISR
jgi:hypothetical protein